MNIDEYMKAVAGAASEEKAFGARDGYAMVRCCKLCHSPHRAGHEDIVHKEDCPVRLLTEFVQSAQKDLPPAHRYGNPDRRCQYPNVPAHGADYCWSYAHHVDGTEGYEDMEAICVNCEYWAETKALPEEEKSNA